MAGTTRAEKTRQTRLRMLEAAREQFVAHGYGATKLQEIADRAGVSVQTIYFTFGNKRTVLKELLDHEVAGDDSPVATLQRPWFQAVLDAPTAREQLAAHVEGVCEVSARVAPVVEVLRVAAATDPELTELWRANVDARATVQDVAATALVRKPGARAGLSVPHVADVLFGLLSPELYLVLVRDRGWSPERWRGWTLDTLAAQLLTG
ncbi:TetR/AcrR family transcriptional regulator [Saccharomonospora xinjiangensis]|uniref:TetR/AcrR family transcriptional regulator n=1 Tax=Saccharomonospora xinjiangensis TaxID=75294 RepID=UPI0010704731|nr:TetR/AcrR family transcriptional regulator [Saccharomonospora xinjiangensis]QBQ59954.1 putative HTH-type transcriptional regulator TtgW [Saccharomonospora xinjiangensis]